MSSQQTELLHLLALLETPGVGNQITRALIQRFGSATEVCKSSRRLMETIPGIGPRVSEAVKNGLAFKQAEAELNWCLKEKVKVLDYRDASFPQRLRQAPDFPSVLFFNGNTDLNSMRIIAVVGTRKASPYGLDLTRQFILGLSAWNVMIVSGLAYGIDIAAHRAALEAGLPTIGVLGNGLSRVYPAAHKPVAEKMKAHGGLLTELFHEAEPDKENFPKRNRIVAGMVDAVVVIEAATNGGALITADLAIGYNRDVFAFPGRVTDAFSSGCNALIKSNKAGLLTSSEDLLEALAWTSGEETNQNKQLLLFPELSDDEQYVFDFLSPSNQLGIDELALQTVFSLSKLSAVLLALELKGLVRALPGKYYLRTA